MSPAAQISINPSTGAVIGATLQERLALYALRNAAWALSPLHDLGFSVVAKAVRKALPSSKTLAVSLAEAGTFSMPYCDPYWGRLLFAGWKHEPEITNFVQQMRHIDYTFIDGGANYGYWSVIVSSEVAGAKRTVAIEAAADTYSWLETNQRSNKERFQTLNRALGSQSGQTVRIYGAKHEARTTVAPEDGSAGLMEIKTTSLRSLIDELSPDACRKIVVKLDVEGVEIDVLKGGGDFGGREALFIYEEHGRDSAHDVSRYVRDTMGCRVFWLGDAPREIFHLTEIGPIKKSRRHGYNFIATRSPFWLTEIEAAMARIAAG